jgi:hypothetical protein
MIALDKHKTFFGLSVHPVCAIFPTMNPGDLIDLQNDIQEHGLLNPVIVHEGQVVDGRNRLNACLNANIDPVMQEWRDIYKGQQSLPDWIWSINVERRHLTDDQRVAAKVQFDGWKQQQEAKQRQLESGGQQGKYGLDGGRGRKKPLVTNSAQGVFDAIAQPVQPQRAPAVRTQIATQLHVSEYKAQQALNAQKANPELLKKVSSGALTLKQAAKAAKAEPPTKPREPRPFDVQSTVQRVVRFAYKSLARCPAGKRQELVKQIVAKLADHE